MVARKTAAAEKPGLNVGSLHIIGFRIKPALFSTSYLPWGRPPSKLFVRRLFEPDIDVSTEVAVGCEAQRRLSRLGAAGRVCVSLEAFPINSA